jgi:hypothetical protein
LFEVIENERASEKQLIDKRRKNIRQRWRGLMPGIQL